MQSNLNTYYFNCRLLIKGLQTVVGILTIDMKMGIRPLFIFLLAFNVLIFEVVSQCNANKCTLKCNKEGHFSFVCKNQECMCLPTITHDGGCDLTQCETMCKEHGFPARCSITGICVCDMF
ncbi:uncharacterized protein LOC132706340 [Cylas formicarius]|uniref:uncharacterized protein LOC132706340 n=1 Tax=Cylas formicarius TaxID=197179 RepID=UPI00295844F7|nr:uncharacterized protein LOC132706340 [Cylas formicarius]